MGKQGVQLLTYNKLMANFTRIVFLEDVFLETVGLHGLEGPQGLVEGSGGGFCFKGNWGWRRGWHGIRRAEQDIGGQLELITRAQKKVLHALAAQDGLE